MITKIDFIKANEIRTKLLLLIATEQSIKKKSLNNNIMMLNSKSFDEINKKYQINSFKITMSNKIINGGKNLCMSYSSTMNPRSLFNTPQIKEDNKLKEKVISKKIVSKKLENMIMESQNIPLSNKFEKIIIKAKRKISQNKLKIDFLTPVQKNQVIFNPEKQKIIERQKNSISLLRNLANLFKNYNLDKKKTLQRQKTLSVKSQNLKNSEEKEHQSFFHSSNVIPKVKNYNLTAKNVRNNEKKKSHNDKNKLLNNIMEMEDDNDSISKFPSTTKNKKSFKGSKIYFVNNKEITDEFSVY